MSNLSNKTLAFLLLVLAAFPLSARKEERKDILYLADARFAAGSCNIGIYAEWCLDYNNPGLSYYYVGPYFSYPVSAWLSAVCSAYYIQDAGSPYAVWPAAGFKASIPFRDFIFSVSETLTYDHSYVNDSSTFLRSRAGVSWHPSGCLLTPAFWIESYSWDDWIRVKSFAGAGFNISGKCSATVGYLRSFINGRDYSLNHLVVGLSASF